MNVWIAFTTGSVVTFFACALIFGLLQIAGHSNQRQNARSASEASGDIFHQSPPALLWENMSFHELYKRLIELEVELYKAINRFTQGGEGADNVVRAAADVAGQAHMIALKSKSESADRISTSPPRVSSEISCPAPSHTAVEQV